MAKDADLKASAIALYREAGFDRYCCKVCGAAGFAEFEYEQMGVCSTCVRALAHAWIMKHTGEPSPIFSPPSVLAEFAAKRALKRLKSSIPAGLRKRVLERDAYRCLQCGDHRNLEADHVIPESRGGRTVFENLQTLCKTCNCRKGSRLTA